ncbi:MAG: hypothetical protein JNL11_14685 [Bdellovibrionaceae bacterium]|nr:hypothetical protein [Pseudobdellovibrionaceae bacterium]
MLKNILSSVLLLSVSVLVSCAKSRGGDQGSAAPSASETPNCLELKGYGNPITVSGNAHYYYRPVSSTMVSGQGTILVLSGNPVSTGIPYAEIEVLNSNSDIVQCSNTDASGNFSFQVDKDMGPLRVRVLSRAFNSKIKASVLEETNMNQPYAIEASFNSEGTDVGGLTLTAFARQSESSKLEGGAFHIFASIYKANQYIRAQTNDANWVAEKVTVFWKAGFNPYSYFGYPNNLLSFYKPGERKLFILGGKDGNVSEADTDHFDTSVVLHEYGHFLEDVYGKTDSPGGYHNGDAVIDPRLAWSEGFANFFQAASQNTNYYVDTAGFCNDSKESGTCAQNVYFRLFEDGTSTLYDRSLASGEGNFRELSITRTLFKIVSAASSSHPYGAGIPFKEIWNIFTDPVSGFHSSGKVFRTMHLLTSRLDQIISASYSGSAAFWNGVLNNEKQDKNFKEYNNTFSETTSNTCGYRDLSPVVDKTTCYGSSCPIYKMSHQMRSNDFYRLDISQSDIDSNTTIQLSYFQCFANITPTGPSDPNCSTATNVDLDLYLYKQGYIYFDEHKERESGQQSQDIVKKSARPYGSIESGSESISLGQLTPGVYLLNVKANTYGKTSSAVGVNAKYRVQKISGSTQRDLCPQN